jgi:hypothetical protein
MRLGVRIDDNGQPAAKTAQAIKPVGAPDAESRPVRACMSAKSVPDAGESAGPDATSRRSGLFRRILSQAAMPRRDPVFATSQSVQPGHALL